MGVYWDEETKFAHRQRLTCFPNDVRYFGFISDHQIRYFRSSYEPPFVMVVGDFSGDGSKDLTKQF